MKTKEKAATERRGVVALIEDDSEFRSIVSCWRAFGSSWNTA